MKKVLFLCLWGHAGAQNTWVIPNCSVQKAVTNAESDGVGLLGSCFLERCLRGALLGHLLLQTDHGACFSVLLYVPQGTECLLCSQEILVEKHKEVVGGNCGIPVTVFIGFHFYLILTGLSVMLIMDSAPHPSMLLILWLIISFCSLSFCTSCCFFSADKEGFLKSSLQILLYPVFCIPDRLSAGIAALRGSSWGIGGGGGINTR